MKILAIDTSCDDTCISILNIKKDPPGCLAGQQKLKIRGPIFEVLSNVISSQVKVHQKYGGVYPTLAKREHEKNLPLVLKKALKGAKRGARLRREGGGGVGVLEKKPKIDLIAVTVGPGLDPCLWTGINFATDLARQWNLPIIPVNHIESHIFANWFITLPGSVIQFPAICLVVSGGHTQLILMRKIGDYKIIGETRDDAAGECFDKTARILGLPYPGGPSIAQQAAQLKLKIKNEKLKISLPRPMINSKDYDFSFSGLKTAVLYDFKNRPASVKTTAGKPKKEYIREMAKEIQQAIVDVLIKKTVRAAKDYKAKSIILGGGVAANDELREQLNKGCLTYDVKHLVPPKNLCTDNAAMVGVAGYFSREEATKNLQKIKADANLRI